MDPFHPQELWGGISLAYMCTAQGRGEAKGVSVPATSQCTGLCCLSWRVAELLSLTMQEGPSSANRDAFQTSQTHTLQQYTGLLSLCWLVISEYVTEASR